MAGVREAQQRDVSDAACVKAAGWRDSYARLVPAPVLAPFTQPSFWEPKLASLLSFFLVDIADGEVRAGPWVPDGRALPGVAARLGGTPGAWHRAGVDARGGGARPRSGRAQSALRHGERQRMGTHPAGWAPEVTETSMVIPDVDALRERGLTGQGQEA